MGGLPFAPSYLPRYFAPGQKALTRRPPVSRLEALGPISACFISENRQTPRSSGRRWDGWGEYAG